MQAQGWVAHVTCLQDDELSANTFDDWLTPADSMHLDSAALVSTR